MHTTQQCSVTLPHEMADAVKSKVAAGEYATESEVIRDVAVHRTRTSACDHTDVASRHSTAAAI